MSEIKKPEKIWHPCSLECGEDSPCCIGDDECDSLSRFKQNDYWHKWIKSLVENEFSEADIKFLLRSKSYEDISKSIHEYIRRHLEVSDEG